MLPDQVLSRAALLLSLLAVWAAATPLYYGPDDACKLSLVESTPDNLTFNSSIRNQGTYDAYMFLLNVAGKEVKFASFYWTLRGADVMPDPGGLAVQGEKLLASVIDRSRSVPVKIAYNIGAFIYNDSDIQLLAKQPNIELVGVNISGILGSGVLHTKFALADSRHAYVGSSNIDWRSFTQVKELGLLMTNCPTLVNELDKIFQTYWLTGKQNRIPNPWPDSVTGSINATNPWVATIDGHKYSIYIGVSPAQLCPPNWSRDIDAIVRAILSARKFVHVAVMDYRAESPNQRAYWGFIDEALRTAAFRQVRVRLLVSHWNHSSDNVRRFLYSLTALNSSQSPIEGKFFIVPAFTKEQEKIPFARVNHNKYMVTEDTAVICTSNWDGDYFIDTAGTAVYIKEAGQSSPPVSASVHLHRGGNPSIVEQVQAVFQRDWESGYAHWNV